MKLYVFNPDTDMALATNSEYYMPPASARRMAQDLALLPIWYALPGSAVLAASAYNADYLAEMKKLFPLEVQLVTEPELPEYADAQIMPWGWNRAFRRRMLRAGIAECQLPAPEVLAEYRELSTRIRAVALSVFFKIPKVEYTCGKRRLVEEGWGEPFSISEDFGFGDTGFLFKSPLSGSGKGLRWCRNGIAQSTMDWCKNELNKFGVLIVEPIYNKVEDFAMEFYSDGRGNVLFTGYSHFLTNEKGAYQGNLLASDEEVERRLVQYVPRQALMRIREQVLEGLTYIYAERYTGPLGVDMMVCRQEGGHPYAIHPHVEINVRMTMGMVAHELYKNFIAPGSRGKYSVDYYPSNEALQAAHRQDMSRHPLVVEGGRVVSGYLPLVPVTPQSLYRAYVICTRRAIRKIVEGNK